MRFGTPVALSCGVITLNRILVAIDFSPPSAAALELGRTLAGAFNAQLHVLHVVAEPLHESWAGYTPGAEFLELVEALEAEARTRLEAALPGSDVADGRVVIATAWGDASDELLEYADAQCVDLIVCGTHGRRGWDHVTMGSVAERVVRLARCPVLTVHASEAQTRAAA